MSVCVCVCVRVRACVRACMRACVCVNNRLNDRLTVLGPNSLVLYTFSSGASPAHSAGGRVLPLCIYP